MDTPLATKKTQGECAEEGANSAATGSTVSAGIYGSENEQTSYEYREPAWWRKALYDLFLWIFIRVFDGFFREVRTRNGYRVPRHGPIIFVAAPHANQFVDPVVLMGQVKQTVGRRVSFLVAAKSLTRRAVGTFARCAMSIGVMRAQDNLQSAPGRIRVDPSNPRRLLGEGTRFTAFQEKGLIGLPKSLGNVDIESIQSDTELTLRKEFKMQKPEVRSLLEHGTSFKYAAKVDQSQVYHRVFEHLAHNQCIGIFPEGGSHDRTDLLPLKAGVAIMALGCMHIHPDVNVKIVPCGLNYFHPHKFRSRAVVEFGTPIEIPPHLVAKYGNPTTNKEAVKELLDTITEGLKAVTLTCSDYETLMVIQATRRLYAGHLSSKLPLPLVVEMNRRLLKGYEAFKDDPRIKRLKEDIMVYNDHLRQYNIPDHQVETARLNLSRNIGLLISRSLRLLFIGMLALPGVVMFSPVFILAKHISKKKAQEALSASTVKIKAKDVVATWKILISIGVAPALYIFWSLLFVWYLRDSYTKDRFLVSFVVAYLCSCILTYSALLAGDIGMDIFKSLRPLYLSLTTPKGLQSLQEERCVLAERITELVNLLGPQLFPDFDAELLKKKYFATSVSLEDEEDRKTQELKRRRLLRKKKEAAAMVPSPIQATDSDEITVADDESDAVSMVNSDNSLSNIPLFSSVHRSESASSVSTMSSTFNYDFDVKQGNIGGKIIDAVRQNRKEE
ncbi:FAFR489Wp [Eremothecium gossypii FDAG1]|nr:FAFR489Wp [Eremothecium gossypii FDAG1]